MGGRLRFSRVSKPLANETASHHRGYTLRASEEDRGRGCNGRSGAEDCPCSRPHLGLRDDRSDQEQNPPDGTVNLGRNRHTAVGLIRLLDDLIVFPPPILMQVIRLDERFQPFGRIL